MEKIFEYDGRTYHFIPCTAIAGCDDYLEDARQEALFLWCEEDEFHDGDCVIFGYGMPDADELDSIFSDPAAFDSDCETLDTIRFQDGKSFDEWRCNIVRP